MSGAFALALAVGAALGTPLAAAPHAPPAGVTELDRRTTLVLGALAAGDVERATDLARQLARRFPRFALGQLLHAELSALAALDGTLAGSDAPWPPTLLELLLEARARVAAATDAAGERRGTGAEGAGRGPHPLPPAPFAQIGRGVRHLVVVELARSRLSLYDVRDGRAVRVRAHYVASGSAGSGKRREGDRKTPLGLYRIDGAHGDAALPELYGAGALVLDYPNALDRSLGRTGSGIWLHGIPRARLSRAPLSSEGCVTMSNEHFTALRRRIDPSGTLVALIDDAPARDAPARGDASAPVHAKGAPAGTSVHRGLFERYRSGRAGEARSRLSAQELAGLDRMPFEAVTVVEIGAGGGAGVRELTIMDLRPTGENGTRVTLHWTRDPGGAWRLALESVEPARPRASRRSGMAARSIQG